MKKILIIDNRMRKFEKDYLRECGYELIELKKDERTYPEISSHVDIFFAKIGNNIICEPKKIKEISDNNLKMLICGEEEIGEKYPLDIKYNVCCIGNKVIHNFKYTDSKIKEIIKEEKYEMIHCNQGYTNCSIAIIDDKSIITADQGVYRILENKGIDVLYIDWNMDIKLLNERGFSKKKGFIGGSISRIEDKVIVFGDLSKIDKDDKIRKFINGRNFQIIEFKNQNIIDYGGILELN